MQKVIQGPDQFNEDLKNYHNNTFSKIEIWADDEKIANLKLFKLKIQIRKFRDRNELLKLSKTEVQSL